MAFPLSIVFDLLAVDKASPAFNRVAAAAAGAGSATEKSMLRMSAAGKKMGAIGSTMSKRLTLPLLAIGAASVKAATDFNASMTRIQTQAGASAADVKVLTKGILDMKGAQQGPNELAAAMYHLKSVGIGNAAALKDVRIGSDLAAVGNANLEETINALAGAWRTGIKGATDFKEAAATVNAVIGAGNMQLPDLIGALGTGILPSAKTFGLTFKDVGAALALFTDESVPADAAATRLRMTFSLLGAPSAKAESELNKIGLTGLQLADDMRKPDGLIQAISDLKSHLEDPQFKLSLSQQAQLLSHAFGGGRSSSAILSLVNNFDVLKKKQDQVTASIGKYDAAVRAQRATPQAQFKEALASLEKSGVLLGNELLPIATQFAHVLTSVASGFNDLSSGQKHFVAEVGVALLVLGPMLSIIGKITKAIALMWAAGLASSRFVAGMRAATLSNEAMSSSAYLAGRRFSNMGAAAKRAAGAVAGIGIGVTIGAMTRDASQLTKGLGVLASTAAGAAIGGPLGALGGLVGSLAAAFAGGSNSAAAAAAELSSAVDGLSGTLDQNTGAVTRGTKAWIAHDLATSGALDQLGALGISYQTATAAALGNKSAVDQVRLAMFANLNAMDKGKVAAAQAAGEILKLATAHTLGARSIRQQNAAQIALTQAHRDGAQSASRNADALGNLAAGSHTVTTAMHTEASAALNLGATLRQLTKEYLKTTNAALGIAQSENQFLDSLHSMRQAIKDSNGSLAQHTAKGRAAQEALEGAAQGALAMDDGTRKGNRSLLTHITNLRNAAIAAGADRGAVHDLLASLNLLPSQINMTLNVNTGASMAKLREIQNQVNAMHGKTLFVGVAGGHAPNASGSFTGGSATGGLLRGPGTGTSDSILRRVSNGEFVVRASQVPKNLDLLNSINKGTRGFANGGRVGVHMPSARVSGVSPSGRGGTGRIVSGSLSLDVDSSGGLIALLRDVVIDEGDLDGTLGRMR